MDEYGGVRILCNNAEDSASPQAECNDLNCWRVWWSRTGTNSTDLSSSTGSSQIMTDK